MGTFLIRVSVACWTPWSLLTLCLQTTLFFSFSLGSPPLDTLPGLRAGPYLGADNTHTFVTSPATSDFPVGLRLSLDASHPISPVLPI